MKIAIIGAGFTGLAAALRLTRSGHQVMVFEKDSQPGGLAIGFSDPKWKWNLERHYHHWFTSDWAVRNLASEIGHPVVARRPITSTYIGGQIYQLDSLTSLLKFPALPVVDRLRVGMVLAYLRLTPWWQPLENLTAEDFLKRTMGERAWQVMWQPLFAGKFGQYADQISAAWFWGRIAKRSATLLYPQGGFQSFADSLATAVQKLGAKFNYGVAIDKITDLTDKFDKVICTLPTPLFSRISGLQYPGLSGLGAVNLVLALEKPFLKDIYWLNINDRSFPFISVVEHTNFMDAANYGGEHIIYIGNYVSADHRYFVQSAAQLLKLFMPYLQKINPQFKSGWIRKSWVFKAPFAQPVVTTRYSRFIPSIYTSISNLYLANIQQVYPWDRGTNYAVELGQRVADLCLK